MNAKNVSTQFGTSISSTFLGLSDDDAVFHADNSTLHGILDRAEWCMDRRYTLLLQPMTRAEVLRYWLVYNEFEIVQEDLVEDGGLLYSVLTARFGGVTRLNDAELYTGSFGQISAHPLYPKLWAKQTKRFQKVYAALKKSGAGDGDGRLMLCGQICRQLEEMKPNGKSI